MGPVRGLYNSERVYFDGIGHDTTICAEPPIICSRRLAVGLFRQRAS